MSNLYCVKCAFIITKTLNLLEIKGKLFSYIKTENFLMSNV